MGKNAEIIGWGLLVLLLIAACIGLARQAYNHHIVAPTEEGCKTQVKQLMTEHSNLKHSEDSLQCKTLGVNRFGYAVYNADLQGFTWPIFI